MVVAVIQFVTNSLCILSMTGAVKEFTVMGQDFFEAANNLTTDYLIPLCAMATSLFTGWFVPKARYQGSGMVPSIHLMILRWVVPIVILIIFFEARI
jgi:SNF family Na+-dependent transporter